ncbi:MAG: MOSC domain-containing protein [Anaerolineae bacterium]|jgi:MOSC domain-containing protein YiiM|nr:MOSC domain-containing protein [Anaerolineae bacterium]
MSAKLVSVNVSLALTRVHQHVKDDRESEWTSGIFKQPVAGQVHVGRLNLAGDQQADLKNHGGEHQAVMAYSAEHYDLWRAELPDTAWAYGGFGENFTISGQDEHSVCIGDVYTVGDARLEVSAQRLPCWKLARRWDMKDLTARVERNKRSGWYMRVLQEGAVEAGMSVRLVARPYPNLTIHTVHTVIDSMEDHAETAAELAACPAFKPSFAAYVRAKLDALTTP